jgi:hypothetical protein
VVAPISAFSARKMCNRIRVKCRRAFNQCLG